MLYTILLSEKSNTGLLGKLVFAKFGYTSNFRKRMESYRSCWDVTVVAVNDGDRESESFILGVLKKAHVQPTKGKEYFNPRDKDVNLLLRYFMFDYESLNSLWLSMESRIFELNTSGHNGLAKNLSDFHPKIEELRNYLDFRNLKDDIGKQERQVETENKMHLLVDDLIFTSRLFDGNWLEATTVNQSLLTLQQCMN